jgi:acyl-CoA reductase-like NAD-dependent aldehyde dehydrogenase
MLAQHHNTIVSVTRYMTPALLFPKQGRGRLMSKLADLMEGHLSELALLESLDAGKPLSHSMLKQIPLCIDNWRYFAG